MKVPFLDLARGYDAHAEEIDARLREVAASGAYVLGGNVGRLERAVADYLDTEFAVGCNSGTDALKLALAALGVGSGDDVITTPFTFAATVEAIEYVGAQPVLVDVDAATCNIDVEKVAAAITPQTRAVIPVHLFGLPARMPELMSIAGQHDLLVVEDCAQSFGAAIGGRAAGTFGNAGAFSFYPTKNLGGLGDGGLVSTDDPDVDRRLRELRNHGIGAGGEHVSLGYNSRLDEMQAAVIDVKLAHIDAMNERRRQIAEHYNETLSAAGALTPQTPPSMRHSWGYYTIFVDDRDTLRAKLGDAGVATALYYRKPLHQHEHFSRSCRWDSLDVATELAARCLSLPIFPEMRDDEVDYVASTTAALLSEISA